MLERLVTWFEERPAARKALPVASVALLLLGVVVMGSSLSSGAPPGEPSPTPVASADLERALAAAQKFYEDQDKPTFEGFNPRTAEGTDSSFTWNRSETATESAVSIRAANRNKVLLVAKDFSGVYCITANARGEVSRGLIDAEKSAECTGGW